MWSLGNESAFGDNFRAMAEYAKKNDFYYKASQDYVAMGNLMLGDTVITNRDDILITVQLDETGVDYRFYPFVDTVKFINIRLGVLCNDPDGEYDYELESTVGYHDCDTCGGRGNIDCEECNGRGNIDCEECTNGYVECEFCEGEPVTCPECDGNNPECEFCEGEPVSCPECDGDKIPCDNCDGDGRLDCYSCDGNGEEQCPVCTLDD